MAKKAYIGVGGVARKVKKGYVGVYQDERKDQNTLLLLHGEDFTDSSNFSNIISNSGAIVSTERSKFSGKSLYFNGGASITLTDGITLGEGDFTVELWIYSTATSAAYRRWVTSTIGAWSDNTFCLRENADGTIITNKLSTGALLTRNAWNHIAVVRSSGTLTMYLNGTAVGSVSDSTNYSEPIKYLGGHYNGSSEYYIGYMDEVRISNIARWQANFTPPTEPYNVVFPAGECARRIKKAYIGIGGVARPCGFGGGQLAYYGAVTPLSVARTHLAAAANGKYAVFGGGETKLLGTPYSTVDAYDAALTRAVPDALSLSRQALLAQHVGEYALFGGGTYSSSNYAQQLAVDAYDGTLTRFNPAAGSKACNGAGAPVGNYAVFAGGVGSTYTQAYADAVAYDKDLTRTIPPSLTQARTNGNGAAIGNYALIAGGTIGGASLSVVDAYDAELTCTAATALSGLREAMGGASNGKYAIFAGGLIRGSGSVNTVEAYDASLTKTAVPALSRAGYGIAGVFLDPFVLFAGQDGGANTTVDVYDEQLTRTTAAPLSVGRTTCGAVIGEMALFGGGRTSENCLDIVEAYTLI